MTHTLETREKIARAMSGRAVRGSGWQHSAQSRQKMRAAKLGTYAELVALRERCRVLELENLNLKAALAFEQDEREDINANS